MLGQVIKVFWSERANKYEISGQSRCELLVTDKENNPREIWIYAVPDWHYMGVKPFTSDFSDFYPKLVDMEEFPLLFGDGATRVKRRAMYQ